MASGYRSQKRTHGVSYELAAKRISSSAGHQDPDSLARKKSMHSPEEDNHLADASIEIISASRQEQSESDQHGTDSTSSADGSASLRKATRRGTGPRTSLGKERSRRNALKHGIFSSVVLLRDEPEAELNSILDGLRKDYRPEGELEVSLVDKLASLMWRQRRLLAAENGEIRKNREFLEWDRRQELSRQAQSQALEASFGYSNCEGLRSVEIGLMRHIDNPEILEECLDLLCVLRAGIDLDGLLSEDNIKFLNRLYGSTSRRTFKPTLKYSYEFWCEIAKRKHAKENEGGEPTPEECKTAFVQEIASEIRRLYKYRGSSGDARRRKWKSKTSAKAFLTRSHLSV